jgi:hypothetical protein
MNLKLDTVLSSLGVLTAVAYALGYLQAFYYFDTFGIPLASVEMSTQDYLLNSWFVIENVLFFLILAWITVKNPRWWSVLVSMVYFLIPIAAHYAFFVHGWWAAGFLIEYRHTVLKFVPFLLLAGMIVADWMHGSHRLGAKLDLSWPYGRVMFILFIIVVGAWSVSMAKHFGSFDANFELLYPERLLPKVRLQPIPGVSGPDDIWTSDRLYLIHATQTQLFVWNSTGFGFDQANQSIRIYVIKRDKLQWFETMKVFEIQRGGLIF